MALRSMHFLAVFLSVLQMNHIFLVTAQSTNTSSVPGGEDDLADFGQTVPILGQMERTDQDFKDGLALDLFSPRNRTLVVTQNKSPLPGRFVSRTTGEPFVALSNYSWIIKVNDTARDLIAKVELPYDPESVRRMGVDVANTYVGVLATDGKSWDVDEGRRNVHVSENKTRIVKLTSLDGEYILLGRQTIDTSNIFVQYGFGATRTVNLTGGEGLQEAEFIDGLRLSLTSERDMQVNIDLRNGVSDEAIPRGMRSINSFAWAVNTSSPNQSLKNGTVRFPINLSLLSSSTGTSMELSELSVAKRDTNATVASKFGPLSQRSQHVYCQPDCFVKVSDLQTLDGEYIIIANVQGNSSTVAPATQVNRSRSRATGMGASLRENILWTGPVVGFYLYFIFLF